MKSKVVHAIEIVKLGTLLHLPLKKFIQIYLVDLS